MSDTAKKQAFTGFKIIKYESRKAKDSEKLKIILEAELDSVGCGEYSVSDLLGAMEYHKSGDADIGFSLFVKQK
jgi:hypothetical protein